MNEVHWTEGTTTARLLVGPINISGEEVGMFSYIPKDWKFWLDLVKSMFKSKAVSVAKAGSEYNKQVKDLSQSFRKKLNSAVPAQGFTNTNDTCKTSKNKINIYVLIILIILFIIIILFLSNSIIKNNNTITAK